MRFLCHNFVGYAQFDLFSAAFVVIKRSLNKYSYSHTVFSSTIPQVYV